MDRRTAAKELRRRGFARKRTVDYSRYTMRGYVPGDVHFRVGEALDRVESGELKRLMISMPPRHGKTEEASVRFPCRFLGKHPDRHVIAAAYNSERAQDVGQMVKDTLASAEHRALFPEAVLVGKSAARDRMRVAGGGQYNAAGVGTAMTGRGAHLLLIDDPFKDRSEADSETTRNRVYAWYLSTAYTRLERTLSVQDDDPLWRDVDEARENGVPFEGAIVLIMCQVGSTQVRMADGSTRALRDIRPGDRIATYEAGKLQTSVIERWQNHGPDDVFEIRTLNGSTRANARHPFLIEREGKRQWIRLSELRPGDMMVRLPMDHCVGKHVSKKDARNLQSASCDAPIIIRNGESKREILRQAITKNRYANGASKTDMASRMLSTAKWWKSRAVSALYAGILQAKKTHAHTGTESCASTMTTPRVAFVACSAMTVTWRWVTERLLKPWRPQQPISDFTLDRIQSITPTGREDVFDVQVHRTENFIADGFVSHNTRWHEDDLMGRLERDMANGADQWEIINIPALRPHPFTPNTEITPWPEKFDVPMMHRIRTVMKAAGNAREWDSLYMGNPTPDEGILFKREKFLRHKDKPAHCNWYVASDFATKEKDGDFTEHVAAGLDPGSRLYLEEGFRGQVTTDVGIHAAIDLAVKYDAYLWLGEKGPIESAIGPLIRQTMQNRKQWVARELLPSVADKVARARAIIGLVDAGMVSVKEGEWGDKLIDQLVSFPAGRFDDGVDACSLFGRALDVMLEAFGPTEKPPEGLEFGTREWLEYHERQQARRAEYARKHAL